MPSPSGDRRTVKKAGSFSYNNRNKTNNQGGYWGDLLLRGVVDEADALLDVALEALDRGVQERLLLGGDALQRVLDLLDTVGLITS